MTKSQGMLVIVACLGIVILIALLKQNMELILNCLIRGAALGLLILFCNHFLLQMGYSQVPGVNLISLCVATLLGLPGVVALYGILFFL